MSGMRYVYTPRFQERLRERADDKMRRRFREKLLLFQKDPYDPQLDNHALDHNWSGCRSFDVTPDWIVVFREKRGQHYLFITCGDKTLVHRPWLFPKAPSDWLANPSAA